MGVLLFGLVLIIMSFLCVWIHGARSKMGMGGFKMVTAQLGGSSWGFPFGSAR